MDLFETLTAAAQARKEVTVVYHGGSQPGRKRQLQPIIVTPREMKARDSTGEVKIFLLSKIEIVETKSNIPEYVPGKMPDKEPGSILEGLEGRLEELRNLGWHVDLNESAVGLYIRFKNGKLRKYPTVGIQKRVPPSPEDLSEEPDDPECDEDSATIKEARFSIGIHGIEMTVERGTKIARGPVTSVTTRPWYVFGPEGGSTFGRLDKAIAVFWLRARKHAPKKT